MLFVTSKCSENEVITKSFQVDLSAELLPQLESLDLSRNQITYLCSLHSFQRLHTLCLSYNCLETFGQSDRDGDVYTFPKLCTLLLDHNCIQSLMDINMNLPAIKHLFLHNNYLQNVNGNYSRANIMSDLLSTTFILAHLYVIFRNKSLLYIGIYSFGF